MRSTADRAPGGGRGARWPSLVVTLALACTTPDQRTPPPGPADGGAAPLPDIQQATSGTERLDGLLTVHLDTDGGRVLVELDPPSGPASEVTRLLWVEGLRTGVGSNPIGIDRGELGDARLIIVRRLGRRVLLEQPNLAYRARAGDAASRRAAEESFATSVLWSGPVVAEDEDGRALVDLTSFFLSDAHHIATTLQRTGQGSYELDRERTLVDTAACHVFPDNIEIEAVLTFSGHDPGDHVLATVPTPESLTVVAHHSWLRLPDDGYRPRVHDVRAGAFSIAFHDTTAPLDAPLEQRLALRHRLTSGPDAEPIIYYVDRGAPGPVQQALLEGARWWEAAFAAAGFPGGFRVELMPEGVHPLDARYNVIQWVHRSTRGWSYGNAIVDPRTGEILKGHVTLGALRVRQDRLLFEGLLGTRHTGDGSADDPLQLALARIRQLSAHEVGHTLGLAHNFAASATVFNGSVMDYPAPDVKVGADGELDTSACYGVGVGPWDVQAIRWLYGEYGEGAAERAALDALLAERSDPRGRPVPPFLSDADARPAGAAQPEASLWDNGSDPVVGLHTALAVRQLALERFDASRVARTRPLATLQEVLATVYFHHRYQLTAAIKTIGGVHYRHVLAAGADQVDLAPLPAADQRRALEVVLDVLSPRQLDLPDRVVDLLPPRPPGMGPNRELFAGRTAPTFDALGAAATAAEACARDLLNVERCGRLVAQHRRDPGLPGLGDVLATLIGTTFAGDATTRPRDDELSRIVQHVVVAELIRLATHPRASPSIVSRVDAALRQLADRVEPVSHADPDDAAHAASIAATIRRHLDRGRVDDAPPPRAPPAPPGSPIGMPTLGECSMG